MGYGAFTHSHSQIDVVARYVLNQEHHHLRKTFREEYLEMLKNYQVAYKDEYLFEIFDDINGWD
jgi:hypothetical protein